MSERKVRVGVAMGSDSDLPTMAEACKVLEELEVPCEARIISAHRTAEYVQIYAEEVMRREIEVIIAGAGGAAHLPGMLAAHLPSVPVIGVPVRSSALNGQDSLLSIVQMPPGIPVATMAIGGAKNAGIMAAQILAVSDKALRARVLAQRVALRDAVREKDAVLVAEGWEKYLAGMKK